MGVAARAWVLEHFVNERVLALAVSYYKSLIARNHPEFDGASPAGSALNPV
jgi:hypothetical protein